MGVEALPAGEGEPYQIDQRRHRHRERAAEAAPRRKSTDNVTTATIVTPMPENIRLAIHNAQPPTSRPPK